MWILRLLTFWIEFLFLVVEQVRYPISLFRKRRNLKEILRQLFVSCPETKYQKVINFLLVSYLWLDQLKDDSGLLWIISLILFLFEQWSILGLIKLSVSSVLVSQKMFQWRRKVSVLDT